MLKLRLKLLQYSVAFSISVTDRSISFQINLVPILVLCEESIHF